MTVFVCERCDSRWVGDMKPARGSICFKCHLKSINIGFTHGKAEFSGPTVVERQRKAVADAAASGRTIEPYGSRWV